MPRAPPFQTTLTFVVRTQNSLKDPLEKSTVNSHIARVTHERRRKKEGARQKLVRVQEQESDSDDSSSLQLAASPYQLLGSGRADPFDSQSVVINASVDWLLSFVRDCLMPPTGKSVAQKQRALAWNAQFIQDVSFALQDECLAYAYLSRFAAILSTILVDNRLKILALTYKAEVSSRLRLRLRAQRPSDYGNIESICWLIYSLLAADVAAQDYAAASLHGKILRCLLQPEGKPVPFLENRRLVRSILWQDTQRATLTLTRTSFELDQFVRHFLPEIPKSMDEWYDLLDDLLPSEGSGRPTIVLDEVLQCRDFRLMFSETKLYFSTIKVAVANTTLINDLTFALATRSILMQAHLVNKYTTFKTEADGLDPPDPSNVLHRHAFMSLATLYWIRFACLHENSLNPNSPGEWTRAPFIGRQRAATALKPLILETAGNSLIYGAGPGIIRALRQIMTYTKEYAMSMVNDPETKFRLWALYVGAIAEQAQDGFDGTEEKAHGNWHNIEFVQHAGLMGLYQWEEVEDKLKKFLYVEHIGVGARKWFVWFQSKEGFS
ncbi:hypothetical protein BP6252_06686 [Coleophoma cylindrospora]|uniref:Transcription factor domain-containing protein n=1 Tax=Coleophoma cylindrospora TaxID=1849047 RepID=A0A3D8RNR9_9HELO|nr:hypothetical protein BP6252_06686 [Coleophoma cylindrospora]